VPVAAGLAAAGALGVVGCTAFTGGQATVDAADVPEYRSSVSASRSAASVTSSRREAERQASLTTQAVRTVCETMSTSSAQAVKTVNAYVDAVNTGGDIVGTLGPARDALNDSADQVSAEINQALPPELRDALTAWVDASRAAGGVLARQGSADEFNTEVDRVNSARTRALDLCDRVY
jgi:enamine deaminase RidA (YjgF/YER057c/UK114 family)